jgi:hypothetical protein
VAKTRSAKRANTEAKDALKGLRSELKRLTSALSKQIRSGSSKKRRMSQAHIDSLSVAAKRAATKTQKSVGKTTKTVKKNAAPKKTTTAKKRTAATAS